MENNKCFFELPRLWVPPLAGLAESCNICSVTWRSNRDSQRWPQKQSVKWTHASNVRLMLHLWIVALVELWVLWGLTWQCPLTSDQFCFIPGNSIARSQVKKANSWHMNISVSQPQIKRQPPLLQDLIKNRTKCWGKEERDPNNNLSVNKWWIQTLSKVIWGIELVSYWLVCDSAAI